MAFAGLTAMVVEDSDSQRHLAVRMLQHLGLETVLGAGNGREALGLLEGRPDPLDVVVCDLDMPEMDGIEFIGALAEQGLARGIVVASAMEADLLNTVETMIRAYGLQMLAVLPKPISIEALDRALSRYRPRGSSGAVRAHSAEPTGEELRQALDAQEIQPFFQPKVGFSDGQVHGVEALARWMRPGRGLQSPAGFVPVLEREGLVHQLTLSMLQQSCLHMRKWDEQGLRIQISVNISMLELERPQVADRLHELVKDHGCDPHRLVLEVTETAVMREAARALNILARLRLKGFGISIDDFGTGYSSMQQLSLVPSTELKVDQSFVRGVTEHPRQRSIVESSLDLARRLGLKTVAEGVETREEWDLLAGLGCDQAQGYFVAKPMPAHQVPAWAGGWEAPIA